MNLRQFLVLGVGFLAVLQVLQQRAPIPGLSIVFMQIFAQFLQVLGTRQPLPTIYRRIVDLFGNDPYLGRDVYADWRRHPVEMMRCIGFTPAEFDKLLHDIQGNMPAHNRNIDNRNCLLLTLWWLRLYPTLHQIALIFDLHHSTAARHIEHMIEILHNKLRREIRWPTNQEWQRLRYT